MSNTTIRLSDYQPSPFKIEHIQLFFDLYDDHTQVKALMECHRVHGVGPLVLNGEEMQLAAIAIDGEPLSVDAYDVDQSTLTIHQPPQRFTLETIVKIRPQDNTRLEGLYCSGGNFCTQCEPHGFRRITYFLDRPDVLTRFTTTITADQSRYPYLLSNGNLVETRVLGEGRHMSTWTDPSLKPCYLFALVAGDFDLLEDTFTTSSDHVVDLKLYVEKGYIHQADYAMGALKRSMRWDEARWGREYDLDIYMIVAVSDFNMGAMENKGLNIFNTKYVLAEPETATDSDYVAIEKVIGHEYFHNWTGNRITCRDWFQITLKEGLTVFRDQEFTADMTSRAVARIDDVNLMMTRQFAEDAGPLAHPIRPEKYIEVNNFYTMTVYHKGAEVIRMIETLVTPEVFRQGLDIYFKRHDGQAVTTEDFIACMEEASGMALTQFKLWYQQAGTPVLDVTDQYDHETQTYKLTVKQSCPPTPGQANKLPMQMPLAIGLVGTNQSDTQVLTVTKPEEVFTFKNINQRPVLSLLRGFSSPVKCRYDYSDQDLATLMLKDSDPFARWNAGQQWMVRTVIALTQQVMAGGELSDPSALIQVFHTLLEQPMADESFMASLLGFPSEALCHQSVDLVHVTPMHHAYAHARQSIAQGCFDRWYAVYQRCYKPANKYVLTNEEMARRKLQNLCLAYLVESGRDEAVELAVAQFESSKNMTDQLGALSALNRRDCPQRTQALAAFYARWQKDPLVVNKWLTLHAMAPFRSTLDTVKAMSEASYFDRHNPNMVYALMCAFTSNVVAFHLSSGEGYHWVASQVIALDKQNPHVAARLIQGLTDWQRFAEPERALMHTALSEVAKVDGLSSDVYEMVEKSIHV